MKRTCVVIALLFCLMNASAQYGYDTVNVYFPINISTLDQPARNTLDSVARIIKQSNILVYGYADYLGNEPANNILAVNRAKTVKAYLVARKVPAKHIPVCEGIGEVKRITRPNNPEGMPEDRRVALFLQRTTARKNTRPPSKIRVTELSGTAMPAVLKKADPKPKAITVKAAPQGSSRFEQLADLETGQVLRIETIHFQTARHQITPESEQILEELYHTLLAHGTLRIRIEGHVCCIDADGDALDIDTDQYNLSVARAKFIYDFLLKKGVAKSRLEYAGYGKRRPIVAVEKTEEDAQLNRRVEFRVLPD